MNRQGITVFLDVHPDVLFRRLKIAKSKRPLLADKTDEELKTVIANALQQRLPYYLKARIRFDAGRLESWEQIDESVKKLDQLIVNNQ